MLDLMSQCDTVSNNALEIAKFTALQLLAQNRVVSRGALLRLLPHTNSRTFAEVETVLQAINGVTSMSINSRDGTYRTRAFVLQGSAMFAAANRERLLSELEELHDEVRSTAVFAFHCVTLTEAMYFARRNIDKQNRMQNFALLGSFFVFEQSWDHSVGPLQNVEILNANITDNRHR